MVEELDHWFNVMVYAEGLGDESIFADAKTRYEAALKRFEWQLDQWGHSVTSKDFRKTGKHVRFPTQEGK